MGDFGEDGAEEDRGEEVDEDGVEEDENKESGNYEDVDEENGVEEAENKDEDEDAKE